MKNDAAAMRIYAFQHHPVGFSACSGIFPLADAVGATSILYPESWRDLQARSWTLGQWLRKAGITYYGTTWNSLVPILHDLSLSGRIQRGDDSVAHFLWGEFAGPGIPRLYRRKARALIGTFHCSARRQAEVIRRPRVFMRYDRLTVVSKTQVPFFVEHGFPEERIRCILLGVDTTLFCPAESRGEAEPGPLRCLLVGITERDHEFMADLARKLPRKRFEVRIRTGSGNERFYDGIEQVVMVPRQTEEGLVEMYRDADVLVMPMLDCTANDAILESMACGTPVMANRIGGIPEYVSEKAGYLMEGKDLDEWVDLLLTLEADRGALQTKRTAARRWAMEFAWPKVAKEYLDLYEEALEER